MKDKLKDIELLIQSGESKKVKAYNLDSILKNVSSDNVDILDKPGPNGIINLHILIFNLNPIIYC